MSGAVEDLQTRTPSRVGTRLQNLTRRDFLSGIAAVTAGLTLDAGYIARHDLELLPRTLRIRRLPEAFHGFRIVQISDIHLEEYTEPAFLHLVLHRVNQLAPDLVLLTGDIASTGFYPHSLSVRGALHCADLLRGLACPERYAVLGNHDNAIGAATVTDALAASGIPILRNRYVPIERSGQRLWLGGLDDPLSGQPHIGTTVPTDPDGPVLLMSHSPDFADIVAAHPLGRFVDLMLSGHTHGGQVRLPFVGPLVLPPLGQKYVHGLFHFGPMQLYVNRGIGTVGLPFRFNCPPEITLFTLQPA